jgi:predicted AlkP superfamily pyrophosphatase or phosphodiesterase
MKSLRVALVGLLAFTFLVPRLPGARGDAPERPRLVVLMVFDQMRGDYPQRWREHFVEGGFKRLQADGAWFTNCHYPYAFTVTAAGHASLATGCSPDKHGIVGNSWYDRGLRRVVEAEEDERYRQLPMPETLPKGKTTLGVSPRSLMQPTVAELLKTATKGKAKVVSLSVKPRSSSLLAGLLADLVYWFSDLTGGFVTSSYYRDEPHTWVQRFNVERSADRWFGKTWERDRPELDYDRLAGPDDVLGESKSLGFGRTFPHVITGGLKAPGPDYYDALMATPMGNDLLLEFAKTAVVEEKLGQDDVPDLLLLSFASNDIIGHLYGPDSHEVLDTTLRTDKLIADLLQHLDAKVGKDKYAVVVSADHGICPLPEVARTQDKQAGRIVPAKLRKDAEAFLQETFGESEEPYIAAMTAAWLYLDYEELKGQQIERADAEKKLAAWLAEQPGMQAAVTRSELSKGMPKDKLGQAVWRSFHPDRAGDVAAVTRPYHFISSYSAGTNHGNPHEYDTHVPLFVLGPGVRPGMRDDRVTPQAAAAIMARLLGIDPPAGAEAPAPAGLSK